MGRGIGMPAPGVRDAAIDWARCRRAVDGGRPRKSGPQAPPCQCRAASMPCSHGPFWNIMQLLLSMLDAWAVAFGRGRVVRTGRGGFGISSFECPKTVARHPPIWGGGGEAGSCSGSQRKKSTPPTAAHSNVQHGVPGIENGVAGFMIGAFWGRASRRHAATGTPDRRPRAWRLPRGCRHPRPTRVHTPQPPPTRPQPRRTGQARPAPSLRTLTLESW